MPDDTGYYGTLEAPMPVKEQAMGPVTSGYKGQFPPTPVGDMTMDRSQNGGTPGKRPVLPPSTHQPIVHA
jgi:hypothetical protein